jgi:hypothetical protein
MPIMWSRIHAELGVSPTLLTHDMVVRAVEAGLAEGDDLDWKQALPPEVEKKRLEFAKDVAAMANTRGGLIVYGVRESTGCPAGSNVDSAGGGWTRTGCTTARPTAVGTGTPAPGPGLSTHPATSTCAKITCSPASPST